MEYNVSLDQLIEIICGESPKGFSEEELQKAEKRIGVRLPENYKSYLRKYGAEEINQSFNQIFEPQEIYTSYSSIEEKIEEYAFERMSEETLVKEANNAYYKLYKLPKDKWDTVVENYVLIACENQGVWRAGFRLKDLEEGIQNPPVYVTTGDDNLSFIRMYDDVEKFLMDMIGQTLTEYEVDCDEEDEETDEDFGLIENPESINKILEENHIVKEKLMQSVNSASEKGFYVGNCVDRAGETMYFYYELNQYAHLSILPFKAFQAA